MEKDLARACLEVRVRDLDAPPDPYASIIAALGGSLSALPAAADSPRHQPPVRDANTVPRQASGGGSARPSANPQNLHQGFGAAAR